MPKGIPKKIKEIKIDIDNEVDEVDETEPICPFQVKTEKEILLELYETLKSRNIRSIGDLENQIANCQ